MSELAAASLRLAEHLMTAARQRIIKPQVEALAKATAERFRKQGVYFIRRGLPKLRASLERKASAPAPSELRAALDTLQHFSAPRFTLAYGTATKAAYRGGAKIAAGELGVSLTEAEGNSSLTFASLVALLHGPKRLAMDVEDELDATTEDRLSTAINAAFVDSITFGALTTAIKDLFADWARIGGTETSRTDTTALNEVAIAFGQGGRELASAYKSSKPGIEVQKAWNIEPSACEICEGNADDGWIPEDLPFASGNFENPAHPDCVCSVSYQTVGGEYE